MTLSQGVPRATMSSDLCCLDHKYSLGPPRASTHAEERER